LRKRKDLFIVAGLSDQPCWHVRFLATFPPDVRYRDVGCRIRWFRTGKTYSAATRCNDRQFLFRPNHNPKNPLLDASCPANALDPNNDLTPVPSLINIIGASVGRALANHSVGLNWFEANLHHEHDGVTPADDAQRAADLPPITGRLIM